MLKRICEAGDYRTAPWVTLPKMITGTPKYQPP
jgi:hypothetical protein